MAESAFVLKVDLEGGQAIDVVLNMTDSTITFSKLPAELPQEDWDAINALLRACRAFMANPRMLKAVVNRQE